MWLLIILILVILFIILFIIYKIRHYKHVRIDSINIISGGVGKGKTSVAICRVISILRAFYFICRNKNLDHDYIILSDFPIGKLSKDKSYRYIKIFNKKIKCYDLDLDIFIEKTKLPQDEVIIIADEFSSIANQFEFNNPNVSKNIDDFVRFFRHYTNGKGYLFCIDQCSNNIFLQVRRRASYCYNMISCKKIKFLPITIFEYRKILLSDEVDNVVNLDSTNYESDIVKCIYFSNPFKWYDSHCFSERYKRISTTTILNYNNINLKRNDVPKITKAPYYSEINYYDNYSEDDFKLDNFNYYKSLTKLPQLKKDLDMVKKLNDKK